MGSMKPWQPTSTPDEAPAGNGWVSVDEVRGLREQFVDFMLGYKFAIEEITTKINILREDFNNTHEYNPIEHVGSRLKSPESVLEKVQRKNYAMDLASIRENVLDIAGVRVVCSFISDIRKIRDMLVGQEDITLLEERDYITHRKPNGYQSLHLIVSIPVFRSDRTERVPVEIQIRTIAMDFWASLEHKIYYKYRGEVPPNLRTDLAQAAEVATQLDEKMEALHRQVDRTAHPRTDPADSLDFSVLYRKLVADQ
ncbi:GTP pyrophosphokinase family protein [Nocardia puris]|uniref:Putative GTP pyrophosphokinase n=2 Tax=Nocardia puris TaxID=208602 RepID=A0A366DVI9_9NOCA|nr:GTP pyrophosphokinase family protein [Nocardia puris]MBF6369382.1 GTP pyrophosphokinase family protein [Nocardia puris]MBF6457917.1 GTP pyrophosphokinase family protein [Nocardia puris]RBO94087.1 putative GTP pyrophosphokinase [Nocardia puris]